MKDATSLILRASERATFPGRRIILRRARQRGVSCRGDGQSDIVQSVPFGDAMCWNGISDQKWLVEVLTVEGLWTMY